MKSSHQNGSQLKKKNQIAVRLRLCMNIKTDVLYLPLAVQGHWTQCMGGWVIKFRGIFRFIQTAMDTVYWRVIHQWQMLSKYFNHSTLTNMSVYGTKTSILLQKFLPAAMNFKPYTQFYVYIDRHTHTHTHKRYQIKSHKQRGKRKKWEEKKLSFCYSRNSGYQQSSFSSSSFICKCVTKLSNNTQAKYNQELCLNEKTSQEYWLQLQKRTWTVQN